MFSRVLSSKGLINNSHVRAELFRALSSVRGPSGGGDKGAGKNFRKKVKKAINKQEGRATEKATSAAISSSLLDKLQSTEQASIKESNPSPVDLSDILGDIKKYIKPYDDVRRNMGMPPLKEHSPPPSFKQPHDFKKPAAVSKVPLSFTEGKRLGIFTKPSPDTPLMPADKWDFHKEDEGKQVSLLESLRPYSNPYEKAMEDEKLYSTWKYPIDNESYPSEEDKIGFEEHVFFDKELANGFPKKGPVRHFMELVITGLSNNHYLSPVEKRNHIQWYRDYFAQFPEDELHVALPSDMLDSGDQQIATDKGNKEQ